MLKTNPTNKATLASLAIFRPNAVKVLLFTVMLVLCVGCAYAPNDGYEAEVEQVSSAVVADYVADPPALTFPISLMSLTSLPRCKG